MRQDLPKCATLKRVEATERAVDSEDSEQTSRDDTSTNKHRQKLSTSKPPSNASAQQYRDSAWEDRLSALACYHNIHGHCNVPRNYGDMSKLGVSGSQTKGTITGCT
jgi:hypothetical protein